MRVETWLLLLESILLVVTIVLLLYSIREGRAREGLIAEVASAKKVLTRKEYFLAITDSMHDARQEVVGCLTGRPPVGDEVRETDRITELIGRATAKGVRVRYLLPKFPDRLRIGLQYAVAGAEVRFSSCLMIHDLRFIVIDEKVVVLGIPEAVGDEEATKKGYTIPSQGLALIMKNYFNSCERQSSLGDYLREVMEQSGASAEHLAREFHLDEGTIRRFLAGEGPGANPA
jgi:hypothetical protein